MLLPYLRSRDVQVIAIVGNLDSTPRAPGGRRARRLRRARGRRARPRAHGQRRGGAGHRRRAGAHGDGDEGRHARGVRRQPPLRAARAPAHAARERRDARGRRAARRRPRDAPPARSSERSADGGLGAVNVVDGRGRAWSGSSPTATCAGRSQRCDASGARASCAREEVMTAEPVRHRPGRDGLRRAAADGGPPVADRGAAGGRSGRCVGPRPAARPRPHRALGACACPGIRRARPTRRCASATTRAAAPRASSTGSPTTSSSA